MFAARPRPPLAARSTRQFENAGLGRPARRAKRRMSELRPAAKGDCLLWGTTSPRTPGRSCGLLGGATSSGYGRPSPAAGAGLPWPSPASRICSKNRRLIRQASRVAFLSWCILSRRQGTIGRHCHNLLHQVSAFAAYCGNFRISCSPPPFLFKLLLSLGEPCEPLLPHRLEPGHKPHVPSIKAAHSDHLL